MVKMPIDTLQLTCALVLDRQESSTVRKMGNDLVADVCLEIAEDECDQGRRDVVGIQD